jgi:hypothetical protein
MSKKTNDSVISKAAKDEPLFTLRAQDRFAPMLVQLWADMCATQHGSNSPKVIEAYETAEEMLNWQRVNRAKFPD